MDTIYALASARGKAGVAIIRISGPGAIEALAGLGVKIAQPRRAVLRRLFWNDVELDQALVIRFDEGASFTGEPVVELHLHGSTAVVSAVLQALREQDGLRLAEAGEFTRRALENGKLDLSQVEGLADLIDAETESQRRLALQILSGAVGAQVEAWRTDLLHAAALIEATIDFADEEVPVDVMPEVFEILGGLYDALQKEIEASRGVERIREGFEVAIIGAPNSGKSTLLNMLAGREAAITSEIAGTTRDVIEVRMDIDGLAVTLLDTAGIRETDDPVEAMGIDLASRRAQTADLRIFLLSGGDKFPGIMIKPGDISLWGKADLRKNFSAQSVSGKTGMGVGDLLKSVSEELHKRVTGSTVVSRERHRQALLNAIVALETALNELRTDFPMIELVAEELRHAVKALESLVGRIDVEAVLGEIFGRFCIGK